MAKRASTKSTKSAQVKKGSAGATVGRKRKASAVETERRISTEHPGKPFDLIERQATSALSLVERYTASVSPRLPAGLVSQLTTDLAAFANARTAQVAGTVAAQASTATEKSALATAYDLVTAVHAAVAHAFSGQKDVLKAWGIGVKIAPGNVMKVLAGINLIVTRATSQPAEATAAGVISSDLTALQGYQTSLQAVHQAHGTARNDAPLTTAQRNQLGRAIDQAVGTISAAGVLAFAHNAPVRAAFEALRASGRKHNAKGGGGSGTPPTGTGTTTPTTPATDPTPKRS